MSKKYPPEKRSPSPKYHSDDYKRIASTFQDVDHKINLSRAFRDRIAKVKRSR